MKRTTEWDLMRLFHDRMAPHYGKRLPLPELQGLVKKNGADIIKALQLNHGHDLSGALSFLRDILLQLDIKPRQEAQQ